MTQLTNRKVAFAVGTAAAVAFTGVASASDMLTINQTEGYVGANISANFIPWVLGECGAPAGGTSDTATQGATAGCPDHGAALVGQAAGIEAENYFTGGDAVPAFTPDDETSLARVVATGDNPFMSGIFRNDPEEDGNYTGFMFFDGLGWSNLWSTPGDAVAHAAIGLGAPNLGGSETEQEEWIDQTLVGYVESIRDSDGDDLPDAGGDVTLAQNFRIQFNMTGTDVAAPGAHIDQRLEQMVELDGATGFLDGDASRQTLQQAFGTNAPSSGNPTQDNEFDGAEFMLGQLVAQDIEGFMFSCFNCDSDVNSGDHAVTPSLIEVRYQPYLTGWDVVPTITHGGVAP